MLAVAGDTGAVAVDMQAVTGPQISSKNLPFFFEMLALGEQPQFFFLASPARAGTLVAVAGDMEAVTGPQISSETLCFLFS
jgi:hypothetical protein